MQAERPRINVDINGIALKHLPVHLQFRIIAPNYSHYYQLLRQFKVVLFRTAIWVITVTSFIQPKLQSSRSLT